MAVEKLYNSFEKAGKSTLEMPEYGKRLVVRGTVLRQMQSIDGSGSIIELSSSGSKKALARAALSSDTPVAKLNSFKQGAGFKAECELGFSSGTTWVPLLCVLNEPGVVNAAHAAGATQAKQEDINALAERLVQCRATKADVAAINRLVDQKKVGLKVDDKHVPWGGLAWQINTSLSVGGLGSDVLIMTTRRGFFLQIASANPKADIPAAAKRLGLTETLNYQNHFKFEKNGEFGTTTLMSIDDVEKTPDYWVGCEYPN